MRGTLSLRCWSRSSVLHGWDEKTLVKNSWAACQDFPSSMFLGVTVHPLDASGFGGVETVSRSAGSGTMRLWNVSGLLRLLIGTSWSLIKCDG